MIRTTLTVTDRNPHPDPWRHIVTPDWVLPAQQPQRHKFESPERRLATAVLEHALADYLRTARIDHDRARAQHAAVAAWFAANDVEWPFSFVNLCDLLGLEADAIRSRLATGIRVGVRAPVRTERRYRPQLSPRGAGIYPSKKRRKG